MMSFAVLAVAVAAVALKACSRLRYVRTMGADGRVLTFGYGSNLCIDRLESRLGGPGTVKYVATGYLAGYTIRFHKRSQDARGDPVASGKGNVVKTANPADRVWGVVFSIELSRVRALDEAEGLGHGYVIKQLPVRVGDVDIDADVYVADKSYIDNSLVPYDWYRRLDGARNWPIPAEYIADIEGGPRRPDPITARVRRESAWKCKSP